MDADTDRPGVRGLIEKRPEYLALLSEPVLTDAVRAVLGERWRVVRSILFRKSGPTNWAVPPHRDEVVAVSERIETPGYGPWSVKEGVTHVRPPREILSRMITARVHLDHAGPDNGALMVWPGSHLTEDRRGEPVVCEAEPGDVLLMRPLIVHASDKSVSGASRRVAHFELSSDELPGDLDWIE